MPTDNYWYQLDPTQNMPDSRQAPMSQQALAQQTPPQYQPYQRPPAPQYQMPAQQTPQFIQPPTASSVGSWVLTLFLLALPIVGLILLFVWAFGSTPDESKRNWARANLIWMLVAIVLNIALFFALGTLVPDFWQNLRFYY